MNMNNRRELKETLMNAMAANGIDPLEVLIRLEKMKLL